MPEQPSSTTRVETALPIAQWPVHLCTRPSCLMSPLWAARLLLLLLNVPAAEQESVQQPEGRVMPPNAHKSFLKGAQPAFVPSAAASETTWCSCLRTIKGMHPSVKGQSEENRRRSPLLPSKSMCTFNGHWGLWSKGWSYMVYAW